MCAHSVCAVISRFPMALPCPGLPEPSEMGYVVVAQSFTLALGTPGLCLLPPDIHPCCCPHAGGLCPNCECCVNTACASCERASPAKPP